MTITWKGCHSNNYGTGRSGHKIDKVIVHWIVGTLASANTTFQNPDRKASAHYGVGGTKIFQWVKDEDTAWHAGNLTVNRQSIGIEHEGGPDLPISGDTYKTSAWLLRTLCDKYSIPLDRDHIKGHNQISATACPGTLDIDRLIKLAKGDNMTDDQKRALDALTKFKEEFNHGNLEGAVNAGIGAYKDLQNVQDERDGLRKIVKTQTEVLQAFQAQVQEKDELIASLQKKLVTASAETDKILKNLEDMTKDRDDWRNRYNNKLTEFNQDISVRVQEKLDKMTTKDLFSLLVKKLWQK